MKSQTQILYDNVNILRNSLDNFNNIFGSFDNEIVKKFKTIFNQAEIIDYDNVESFVNGITANFDSSAISADIQNYLYPPSDTTRNRINNLSSICEIEDNEEFCTAISSFVRNELNRTGF